MTKPDVTFSPPFTPTIRATADEELPLGEVKSIIQGRALLCG
jgi:hypothetical protein